MGAVVSAAGWGAGLGYAVSVETNRSALAAARRRGLIASGLFHPPATTVVLVALYCLPD